LWQVSDFSGYSGFSTNKTDGHDITEILFKVVLSTTTLTLTHIVQLLTFFWDKTVFINLSKWNKIYCSRKWIKIRITRTNFIFFSLFRKNSNIFYIITFIGRMNLSFFKIEQLRTRIVFVDQTKSYIAIRKLNFSLNNIYIQMQTFYKHLKQCFMYQAP
jgi:hypothetical protein